jgi:hypothetical protein
MLTLNERIEGFAGRVSATSVKLTVALPPQLTVHLTVPLGPLQEDKEKAASRRAGRRILLRFI